MPVTTTWRIPILLNIKRRLVPVSALSVVLVTTISPGTGATSEAIWDSSLPVGISRLFQPGIF